MRISKKDVIELGLRIETSFTPEAAKKYYLSYLNEYSKEKKDVFALFFNHSILDINIDGYEDVIVMTYLIDELYKLYNLVSVKSSNWCIRSNVYVGNADSEVLSSFLDIVYNFPFNFSKKHITIVRKLVNVFNTSSKIKYMLSAESSTETFISLIKGLHDGKYIYSNGSVI